MADLVRIDSTDADAFWRVTFGGGKGNVLDRATLAALSETFRRVRATPGVKAVCLEGAGSDFSFGASIQEHLPDEAPAMLLAMRDCVLDLVESGVVVVAAVRGRCLGGGLELASLCHRLIATPDASFGQPEIVLGVFAPVASLILPDRVGRARAEDLCLTGRLVGADDARAMGLVDDIKTDPAAAALAWARAHLGARSASSLRFAVRAVRASLAARLRAELPELERVYLDDLMATADAVEGLRAFLEKRTPLWKDA
jgi:cyclohexa-1,5-dienecarbonyl-CoA hydratase